MSKQIFQKCQNDINIFMDLFKKCYKQTLNLYNIQSFLDKNINKIFKGNNNNQNNNNNDIKNDDDSKNEIENDVILCGSTIVSYHFEFGLDRGEHFYGNIMCWCIKYNDSNIKKFIKRHSHLDSLKKNLEKKYPKMSHSKVSFPTKKTFHKNDKYYNKRYMGILQWLHYINTMHDVNTSNEFMNYFEFSKPKSCDIFYQTVIM